jgi:DNA-binding beta-propeller fold protein YncE
MNYLKKASKYLLPLLASATAFAQQPTLNHLGSYQTEEGEGAAEIVSFDKKNNVLFMINGTANTVDRLDASTPSNLTKLNSLDISAYGSSPTSVSVFNDLVAIVTTGIASNQDKGRLVFLSTDGTYINDIEVGFLPDMVTFSPDGTKVIVANEGEPSPLYDIDPVGSITVIDISNGATSPSVTELTFDAYNNQKAHL